jgi:hypothetical protein
VIDALSELCGCTVTTDGAFFTGTNTGIGDGHYVSAAPNPVERADICCWRTGFGRWM